MEYLLVFIVFVTMVFVLISIVTVPESKVGVLTLFGRYCGILQSGFNLVAPWKSVQLLSLKKHFIDLNFHAVTLDQENVHLECTVLYSVLNNDVDTIKRAVYTFSSKTEFENFMRRLLENEIRSYVVTKKQAVMIGLSDEMAIIIKARIDMKINEWGYGLEDLHCHNFQFDTIVTSSMARDVVEINKRKAAERTAWKSRDQGCQIFEFRLPEK
jgi:regulator of protease activity HflC (stomatin/prohibitin superfamily)